MRHARDGQVVVEYFILFAIVAAATLLALGKFANGTSVARTSLQNWVNTAAAKISSLEP